MMLILIVEDNALTADSLTECLRQRWFDAHFVGDGLSALTFLDAPTQHKPDVMLIDSHMPGLGGDELLERLENDQRWSSIPVVVITAAGILEQKELKEKHAKVTVLAKPFQLQELLAIIEQVVKVRQ